SISRAGDSSRPTLRIDLVEGQRDRQAAGLDLRLGVAVLPLRLHRRLEDTGERFGGRQRIAGIDERLAPALALGRQGTGAEDEAGAHRQRRRATLDRPHAGTRYHDWN